MGRAWLKFGFYYPKEIEYPTVHIHTLLMYFILESCSRLPPRIATFPFDGTSRPSAPTTTLSQILYPQSTRDREAENPRRLLQPMLGNWLRCDANMGLVVHLHSHTRRKEGSANLFSHDNPNQPAYDKEKDKNKHEKSSKPCQYMVRREV